MINNEIKEKIIDLFKRKELIESEIETIQNQIVRQLCPKQKNECEPAYCTFRVTETCPFIQEWNNINSLNSRGLSNK